MLLHRRVPEPPWQPGIGEIGDEFYLVQAIDGPWSAGTWASLLPPDFIGWIDVIVDTDQWVDEFDENNNVISLWWDDTCN